MKSFLRISTEAPRTNKREVKSLKCIIISNLYAYFAVRGETSRDIFT